MKKQLGYTPTDWQLDSILEALQIRPATQTEIADQLGIERKRAFEMICQLERKKKIKWNSGLRKFEIARAG